MSSRQLRKLQQQRELELAQAKLQALEEEEELEDEPFAPTKSKASLFANLAALEDEDQDEDEPEEKEEHAQQEELSDSLAPTSTAPKKPKKSKKKKKAKHKAKEKSAEEERNGADDIDAALRELAIKKPSGGAPDPWKPTVDPEYERVCELLGINTQHLKVANEMRNLFGRTAADNHDDAGGSIPRGGRRNARRQQREVDLETALKGHHAPGKGLPELTLRRNNFIQGKDDWPRGATGGLRMEVVDQGSQDGTVEFRYAHDKAYQETQQVFQSFVEMGDPQSLIGFLIRTPYQVSLLIQVSKFCKHQGDHALSSDLLERALFSFGRASTSLFNTKLLQGKARLDFSRPENRELWLAGYQYIKSLIMKGTYRTAFEWAKLLLSLDPEGDPYCMRLMIHHLALRAHEFNWLLDVSESNMPEIWTPPGLEHSQAEAYTRPSLAFAALQLREGAKCRELLTDSMRKLPWLFTRLFKELSLDAPPSIWGILPRTDAETLFTEIYVLQTKDLWNTPEATSILMEVAHTIKKIDVHTIPTLPNKEMTLDVARFVYLDDKPALMAMAPSNLLHRSNNSDSDPLPPDTNVYSYDAQRAWIEGRGRPRGGGVQGDFFDPLAALGRLVPGFRRAEGAGEEDEDDEVRLRRGLEAIAGGEVGDGHVGDEGEEEERQAGTARRTVAQRLLAMFGWVGGIPEESEDEEWEHDDDTDDEMPELIDEHEEHHH